MSPTPVAHETGSAGIELVKGTAHVIIVAAVPYDMLEVERRFGLELALVGDFLFPEEALLPLNIIRLAVVCPLAGTTLERLLEESDLLGETHARHLFVKLFPLLSSGGLICACVMFRSDFHKQLPREILD